MIVDVGGGEGAFIATIMSAYPTVRGILFDQPRLAERARTSLQAAGVSDRCRVIQGDFFQSVPGGGDAYLLKWILHDWNDRDAIAILRSCRQAIRPGGALIVVEHIVGRPNEGPEGKLMDLNMMVMTGGMREHVKSLSRCSTPGAFD